ncbi:hypothetical protein N798_02200 [Knoellia flava TL1]|uniref:Uncharacterized protein n=2 Tax=Knoellia flava TaxID=913969 RepID=A0A8H9KQX3_9MICO|nr:hypothetical protein [Knoellia flava]KGN35664.1 hypothetical protein N798_02200 [Knoellia flava TL1]GGB76687.1 hypothetical protein GCM10011314_15380 [Knoellia flava]
MENSALWVVGVVALAVVVAAFVWVLRHRDDAAVPEHHHYAAPEVTGSGGSSEGVSTFGGVGDAPVDETVPLSRLGGAGWRDGGAVPQTHTTDSYAVGSPTWAEDPSADATDSPLEHHVSVESSGEGGEADDELDRRRGGHW